MSQANVLRTRIISSIAMVMLAGLALSGCSVPEEIEIPSGTPSSPSTTQSSVSSETAAICGIAVKPSALMPGGEITVARHPAQTDDPTCAALQTGSTQFLDLSSETLPNIARAERVPVQLDEEGAFSGTLTVPEAMRLGPAQLSVVPSAETNCTPGAPDCIYPSIEVNIAYPASQLALLDIAATDLPTPALNYNVGTEDLLKPWVVPGPHADELTIVMYGTSCETRPVQFLQTSPSDVLSLVSQETSLTGEGCETSANLWTTVITLPDAFPDPDVVKVDNVVALRG